jgi:hypothetical protein
MKNREAEPEAAIRVEKWKAGQTLPKLRHGIALILNSKNRRHGNLERHNQAPRPPV